MANVIDRKYFNELAERDPGEVCMRTACRYDGASGNYVLPVWGDDYLINPRDARIESTAATGRRANGLFLLFIVYYLLRAEETVPCNQWVSEKDLPGGATFFRGPHEIPTRLISKCHGNDIEAFGKRCCALSGVPLGMADAAYRFDVTSNIPVAVLYWTGDDEFPPEAKLMFDRTISRHLTLDIVFSLAVEICERIGCIENR